MGAERSACIMSMRPMSRSIISWVCDMEATRVIYPVFRAGLDSLPYIHSAAAGIVSACFISSSCENFRSLRDVEHYGCWEHVWYDAEKEGG